MKTYKKSLEFPRLKIGYDSDAQSPRDWDNLGYFITVSSRRNSPDENLPLYDVVEDTAGEASNVDDHMQLIKERYEAITDEKVLAIYPVNTYEHSGISYNLGTAKGFDYSNNSFYVVTDKTQLRDGVDAKDFEKIIAKELDLYTAWANGEVYRFKLFDENGECVDSCGGFYEIQDIKECLPEDWKDEKLTDYFQNV